MKKDGKKISFSLKDEKENINKRRDEKRRRRGGGDLSFSIATDQHN